jgi:hypothetical protein
MTKDYRGLKTEQYLERTKITFECPVCECPAKCGCGHLQYEDKNTTYTVKTTLLLNKDEKQIVVSNTEYEPELTWKCPQHPEAEPTLIFTDNIFLD